jgi:hypothetical protein
VIYRPARKLAEVTPETVRLVVGLASISKPRVPSYSEITDAVLRATEGLWIKPSLVRRVIACHAPALLASRAVQRAAARPRVPPHDGRRERLPQRLRALIFEKARQLVERPDGSTSPAYTLKDLGKLSPRPLGRLQVRRLLLSEPGGPELLRARLEARRGSV